MSKNTQDVINAYSTGAVYENWGSSRKRGLSDYESALIQTYCSDRDAAILTVGCGAGRETFALYKLGFRNVRGVDCTEALLQVAMNRNKEEGLSIELKLAMADNLPYPSNTFDIITVFENVYGHITPHSARMDSLTEIKRVLKPGGLVMIVVNSIYHRWRYFAAFKILETFRMLYNPNRMEKGDKFWGHARKVNPQGKAQVKIHWFRPKEVPEDARKIGLSVLQATTIEGILKNPKVSSTKLRGQGWLIYVLQRLN
jgi:ubiquinone/menaquinone biosynthesis C-methylase UbiE